MSPQTKKKIQEYAIIILGCLLIGLIAGRVSAAELNSAGPAQVVAGGTAQANLLFNANSMGGLPIAVMVYSSDGAEFWVKRNGSGVSTLETIPMPVPEGSSLIIPVSGWQVKRGSMLVAYDDTFRVKININAASVAVGDSVFCIPMYR